MRVRVSELAKEFGLETKAILAQFNKLGIPVKNHLSMVSEGEVTKLRSALHPGKSATDRDAPQKSGSKIFIRRKVTDTLPAYSVAPAVESASHTAEKEENAQVLSETTESFETKATDSIEQIKQAPAEIQTPVIEPVVESVSIAVSPISDISNQQTQNDSSSESTLPVKKETVEQKESSLLAQGQTSSMPDATSTAEMPTVVKTPAPSANATPVVSKNVPPTVNPRASFTGATIVRRAPENVYQVNMTKPARPTDSAYQGQRRPYSENKFGENRFGPRPPSTGAQPQKSFVMPDSSAAVAPTKEASRFKDYGKDKEKRRHDENERNNKSRLKGARFYEKTDFDETSLTLEDAEGNNESAINVRTMVSPKKRKSHSFKKRDFQAESASNPTKASKKIIRIDEHISVNDLASELSQKSGVVIKTLMKLGMLATANKVLDFDTATLVANEFSFETQNVKVSLEDIIAQKNDKQQSSIVIEARPPIITIMGHVDHGKTSLLDALRSTNVVASEAGGITQHIGAYQIEHQNRKLTFLDTPGHEAFTAMRARGAKVTDIVVLVVAADDGVMPQTIEAIAHAKAGNVPLIVAINKIDKPSIDIDRITRELADQGVMSEEWGGDSIFVKVSAKTRQGLDSLIESILLQADVLELKAPITGFAEGVVIEAKRDKARGPVATVIVTKGLLKQQDSIVIGKTMGRVRAMYDNKGAALKEATPGTPVELIGLDNVPDAGDMFNAVASDAIAREAVAYRVEKHRQAVLASQKPASMDDLMVLFEQKESSSKANELPIIIKADTHGSAEAIKASLHKLDTAKVKTKVILSAVGGITETDVVLADASRALILGFNVRPDKIASQRAESNGLKIMFFNIIYELIEAVKVAMAGTLAPIKQDKIIGHAEVRNLFTVPKIGVIAGSFVTDGKITRPCRLRVVRDGIVLYAGQLGSLKRFKDDAKEVAHGFECGIGVENYNDLKIGDVLEAYIIEEIAAEL